MIIMSVRTYFMSHFSHAFHIRAFPGAGDVVLAWTRVQRPWPPGGGSGCCAGPAAAPPGFRLRGGRGPRSRPRAVRGEFRLVDVPPICPARGVAGLFISLSPRELPSSASVLK